MTNEAMHESPIRHSDFVILSSFDIRASSFIDDTFKYNRNPAGRFERPR